jgi:hypothetical protein
MSLEGNRSRNSFWNAVSAVTMTLVNGLLGIVVTRLIIEYYGSDFNGINSTANQIVNVLLVLEGGFTLASNVALFAPLTQKDYRLMNGILAATKSKFKKIALLFCVNGIIVSVVYALAVNSELNREFIATVVIMTVVPQAFNLYYATVYRVLLQTQQKEYVINLITALTIGLGHIANIVMILRGGPMWMVRTNTMIFALINSCLIGAYVKRKNSFLNLKEEPRKDLILGTGDVMAQKITGVIYNSAPIIFLSISPSCGTLLASVYAVYNNVFTMLKSLLHGFIDAPRLSFGQLLTERKRADIWPSFAQYEYLAFLSVFTLLTSCFVLILPFISLYTKGINDVNYYDSTIALLMVLITVIEMIHIPSGHLINMAGEFRISKNFQVISCIALIILMTIGGLLWGVYGMLAAILIVAILLAVLEMGYVHCIFFEKKMGELLKLLLPLVIVGIIASFLELRIPLNIKSYTNFIVYGFLALIVNGILGLLVGLLFNRNEVMALLQRGKLLIYKK